MSDTLREAIAKAINEGLGPSWAYSNWKGNEYANCRHMLDDATDAALAAIKDAGYAVVPVAVKTRDAEIERLRGTVALLEKCIIQLQGHDSVYCQNLKPYGPSDKGTTE